MKRLFIYLILLISLISNSLAVDVLNLQGIFIYKFTNYITWEKNDFQNFYIGVYGDESFYKVLTKLLKNKSVGTKKIIVTKIEKKDSVKEFQIIFVGDQAKSSDLQDNQALIITNSDEVKDDEFNINMKLVDNKIRFDVNNKLAKDKNIMISSRLLSLAHRIIK